MFLLEEGGNITNFIDNSSALALFQTNEFLEPRHFNVSLTVNLIRIKIKNYKIFNILFVFLKITLLYFFFLYYYRKHNRNSQHKFLKLPEHVLSQDLHYPIAM